MATAKHLARVVERYDNVIATKMRRCRICRTQQKREWERRAYWRTKR